MNRCSRMLVAALLPLAGREYGVARYERIRDADFAAADRYYAATRQFWRAVMADWEGYWKQRGEVTLTAHSDQSGAFMDLFRLADEFAAGRLRPADMDARIRAAHTKQGAALPP